MSILTCKNLQFRYRKSGPYVLDDISLDLRSGHIYGLLGKNGVGKSTLFRVVAGLNPLTSGEIETLGVNPMDRLPSMLSEIYLLPEEMEFPNMTVDKYGTLLGTFYPNFSMTDMLRYMDDFFLPADIDEDSKSAQREKRYLRQTIRTMSQGQRKKASIAIALACHTKLLLMDEPTNGLDIPSKTVFRRMLDGYRTADNLIVISTHQVRDLESLIDGVIIIDDDHRLALCETGDRLMKAFVFGEVSESEQAIYEEEGLHKKVYGIKLRTGDMPEQSISELDLELLFNAAMVKRDALFEALNSQDK